MVTDRDSKLSISFAFMPLEMRESVTPVFNYESRSSSALMLIENTPQIIKLGLKEPLGSSWLLPPGKSISGRRHQNRFQDRTRSAATQCRVKKCMVISVLGGKANRNKDTSCWLGNTHAGPKWIALKRQMFHELTVEEVVQANPRRNIFDVCTDRVIGNSAPIVTDLSRPF